MATTTQTGIRSVRIAPGDIPDGLTFARIKLHDMSPEHVRGVRIEEVDPAREKRLNLNVSPKRFDTTPKADLEAFGLAIYNALKDSVAGYMLQVRQDGVLVHSANWNWSQTPADSGEGWTENRRMHVASVSKFFTAVGMVKALDGKGISYDSRIDGYLPGYWSRGSNIDRITFRDLLTHRSGFSGDGSRSDYLFMKERVAAGVAEPPGAKYDYQNMNFGLCRILIPIVAGRMSKDADFPEFARDPVWDALTIYHYRSYMQAHVFTPAGVSDAGFAPKAGGALAYRHPHDDLKGWDSGDLATVSGGAGWRLSCKEVLDVMSHVRRMGTIVAAEKAQAILDNRFGIDQILDTPAGKTYNKNGAWRAADGTEQCVAYFLPAGMEAVLFVNSPVGRGKGFSLRGLVQDAYVGSLSA